MCVCYICIREGSVHYFVLSRWSHCVVYIVEFCAMCLSLSCIIQFVVCAVSSLK